MTRVCRQCHSPGFYENFFAQFDDAVELYNEKFALPALQIMQLLREAGKLTDTDFDEPIEWTYFYLWHHEGRRARHGAAMMGPDYTWWHGIYDVMHNFYFKFLPAARAFSDADVNAYIDKLIAEDPMHKWLSQSTDELKNAIRTGAHQKIYSKLFGEKP